MNDKEKISELMSELYDASVFLNDDEFEDQKPALMVKAGLMLLALLLNDYSEGNSETSTLFCELLSEMFSELEKKENDIHRFERLVQELKL